MTATRVYTTYILYYMYKYNLTDIFAYRIYIQILYLIFAKATTAHEDWLLNVLSCLRGNKNVWKAYG